MNKGYFKLPFALKFKRADRKATKDGFNGYGKYRANSILPYGVLNELRKKSGIYYIKNNITNLTYIGSSKDIGERISKHFSQMNVGNHPNHKLLEDFNKYGISSFDYGVLEFVDENLKDKERDYQLKYGIENLYNLQIKDNYHSKTQLNSWKHSNKDSHQTDEYRAKMRTIKQNRIGRFDKVTGELLETFDNSNDAACKYSLAISTILGCCNGSKKSAGGYKWHYLDNDNNILDKGKGRVRNIIKPNEDIV